MARAAPDEALHMDEMRMNKPCSLAIFGDHSAPNEWMPTGLRRSSVRVTRWLEVQPGLDDQRSGRSRAAYDGAAGTRCPCCICAVSLTVGDGCRAGSERAPPRRARGPRRTPSGAPTPLSPAVSVGADVPSLLHPTRVDRRSREPASGRSTQYDQPTQAMVVESVGHG